MMLKKTHGLTLPLLRAVLTALPLLITQPGFAMPDTPSVPAPASVRVGFSPEGSATQLVLDTINNARYSIRMMAYSFTDPDVMKALGQAKKHGVDVRIVVDYKGNTHRASQEAMKYITMLDIPLRTVDVFPIAHDKVIIFDENTVETGSYNFSRAAARKNSENVIVLQNMPDIAALYLAHWQDRWDRGTDWQPGK
ncbi:phospholipase D family protein [Salmonella enterica subsp. enterica serovar Flottbek]|nr:phospholipase D family protein [Salmonella enterica subsp. enterica serovar Flottbek]EHT1530467.1 phospholipase D family protein [Salmonella enterica subsp. enterica serovar Enteritidis]